MKLDTVLYWLGTEILSVLDEESLLRASCSEIKIITVQVLWVTPSGHIQDDTLVDKDTAKQLINNEIIEIVKSKR